MTERGSYPGARAEPEAGADDNVIDVERVCAALCDEVARLDRTDVDRFAEVLRALADATDPGLLRGASDLPPISAPPSRTTSTAACSLPAP